MSNECKIIMSLLEDYIKLKDDYKEYNKETLYDIYTIFDNEVFELCEISSAISKDMDTFVKNDFGFVDKDVVKEIMETNEENLVNELADVLLTTARLIKTFNLEEPLIEMIGYKYYRQFIREEKTKNQQKITG